MSQEKFIVPKKKQKKSNCRKLTIVRVHRESGIVRRRDRESESVSRGHDIRGVPQVEVNLIDVVSTLHFYGCQPTLAPSHAECIILENADLCSTETIEYNIINSKWKFMMIIIVVIII